jgi:hypothetical protein
MTTFTRKNLVEYAGDVTATDLQVVGSDAAGLPVLSDDPEVLQANNAYKQGLLNIKNSSSNDLELKEINSLFYIHNYHLNYIFQKGLQEYNADTAYQVDSYVRDGIIIYKSLTNSNLNNPVTDTNKWEFVATLKSGANVVFVNALSDLPTPVTNNITLADNTAYIIFGTVNVGTNSITYGNNSSLLGNDILTSKLIFEGSGSKLITRNQSLYLRDLFITCDSGQLFDALDIDYLIDPAVDPFQGRGKFFRVINCVLFGGTAGNGSDVGYIEGFATTNFNNNVVRNWDIGLKASNGLSFEATANKSVLWNQQGADMITLRDDNWSNQPDNATGYIPTGINALIITGNILHPKNNEFAWKVEIGHNTKAGTISGNTFILTGNTTGGILNPAGQDYNDLANFTIKNNQGGIDNTALIQSYIDPDGTTATTALTQNVVTKVDFNDLILSSNNLFFSQRILVNSTQFFEVQQIITGQTSTNTAKIRSIDAANNYLYVDYIVDGSDNPAQFTVGETLQSATATTTYNGIDGSWKYSGNRTIQCEVLGNFSLEKTQAGSDPYALYLYKNGSEVVPLRKKLTLSNGQNNQATISGIFEITKDDIIEIYIANNGSSDDVICQGMNIIFSER